jgi:hypothetical protein
MKEGDFIRIILFTIVFLLLILSGCETNSTDLKTDKLKLVTQENDLEIYSAQTLNDAINSIPFSVKLPKKLPADINFNKFIISNNKGHIILYVIGESKNMSKKIVIGISNKLKVDKDNLSSKEEILLKDFKKVDFIPKGTMHIDNKKYDVSMITWNTDDYEYVIGYLDTSNSKKEIKRVLLDLGNQLQ